MINFPVLQSGSMTQYPLVSSTRHSTEILRFVDGSEQRYSQIRAAKAAWKIVLRDLNPVEAAAVIKFAELSLGSNQGFSLRDPVSGTVYNHCRLTSAPVVVEYADEHRTSVSFDVLEVG